MKKHIYTITLFVGGFFISIFGLIMAVPIVNNHTAKNTAKVIEKIELPANTEYVENFWKAGKLVGNGNGMQYLGGILVRSELTIEELRAHYSQHLGQNDYDAEKQSDQNINIIEHGNLSLQTTIDNDNYYIIYLWGNDESVFSFLDIRGH